MKKLRLVCETNQTGKKNIQERGRGGGWELPPKSLERCVTFFLKPVSDSPLSDPEVNALFQTIVHTP